MIGAVLRDRFDEVERRIRSAAERVGRRREDITLMAVTKKFPASIIRDAYEMGIRHFGENYVQEFEEKSRELPQLPQAVFHLIGHLQSNKAKKAADLFQAVDSIDSSRLAARLAQAGKPLTVMIEVKLSEEEAKTGASPADLPAIIDAIRSSANLTLAGLMTMPPWSENAELSRPFFRRLRELACAHQLEALSMGMSHDLEVAIEEGATHVRVGTALFGPRRKP
jgi:pyridoxal phosphate enzyme (YggS family)